MAIFSDMWKVFENIRVEGIGLAIYYLLMLLESFRVISSRILTMVLLLIIILFYLIKIIRSFKDWRTSKGASLLNFFINFIILGVVAGTTYLLVRLPGGADLLYSILIMTQYLAIVFGIVVFAKWQMRPEVYSRLTKVNLLRVAVALVVCLLFFYFLYDLPEVLRKTNPPQRGLIPLI